MKAHRGKPLTQLGADLVFALISCLFVYTNTLAFITTGSAVFALSILESALIVLLFVLREAPRTSSTSVREYLVAFLATSMLLLMRPIASISPTTLVLATSVMTIGLAITTVSLLYLGRSFGVVPALRILRTTGPYALVRHPMYAGELLAGAGYVIGNASVWNICVLCAEAGLVLLRIRMEEHMLEGASDYASYRERTRFRLIPFVF